MNADNIDRDAERSPASAGSHVLSFCCVLLWVSVLSLLGEMQKINVTLKEIVRVISDGQ